MDEMLHSDFADKKPVSTGFCDITAVATGIVDVIAYGKSSSLKLNSNPDDANIIKQAIERMSL